MTKLGEISSNFKGKKILVVGDVILDKYIIGEVSRISPEAPVPVLEVRDEFFEPGGAANVAANLSTLEGRVNLFGFIGQDEAGVTLKNLLEEKGIVYYFGNNSKTTLKIRPKVKNQQLLRIDYEDKSKKNFNSEIIDKMRQESLDSDLIVISDYDKGTISPDLIDFIKGLGKRIIADPKPSNIHLFSDVFLIKLNEKEAFEISKEKDIYLAGRNIRARFNSDLIITCGEKGMVLFSDKELEIPTYAKEVYDVSGAGDTTLSALALSIASGASLEEAAIISNYAAGIAVGKAGTYQVRLSELERELLGGETKIKTLSQLKEIVNDLRKKGKRTAWTNGCFDLIHEGHVKYLSQAKQQADYLIVGINSDDSVRRLKQGTKGIPRPIRPQEARAEIISSLGYVDSVTIFSDISPIEYIKELKPEVYVKGGDYALDTINQDERRIVEAYGGKIALVGLKPGISTSKILSDIENS
jgi:D-beta-D-heptose 7-phosphate kinase/D-beta-D-heptose 1-phosphate adenosyltransferase